MYYVNSKSYLRSRNTLIMFVILFVAFIISFKFVLYYVTSSIIDFTADVVETGIIDPMTFVIDWSSFDYSKLNPLMWQLGEVKLTINNSLHRAVDFIAPALVNIFSMVVAHSMFFKKTSVVAPMLVWGYPYTVIL